MSDEINEINQYLKDKGIDVETGEFVSDEAKLEAKEEIKDDIKTLREEKEEIKEESTEEVVSNKEITEEIPSKEVVDIEKEAAEKGWKPGGPKSAEEFLRAEPLYDEIKARGKEIKELKRTIDEMKEFMDKQKEMGYRQALEELKSQRKEAISQGDVELVDDLDKKIKETEVEYAPEKPKDNEFYANEFLGKYKSIMEQDDLFEAYVMKKDSELAKDGLPPKAHFKLLEMEIMQKFQDKLNPKKEEVIEKVVPTVESNTYATKTKSKEPTFVNLKDKMSKLQIQNAYDFEKKNIMSKDQYVKELIEMGEL